MRLHDPHRGRGYAHFQACYKPLIRPDGQLRRLRRAFEIDAQFEEEFKLLSPWLRRAQKDWACQIVDQLLHYDGIQSTFDENDRNLLRKLYDRHAVHFASGRIDEQYLDSLEDVALFFLYHEVRSVWLAGAYGHLQHAAVDYFYEVSKDRRQAPFQRLMRCFLQAMTIELSQLQRVFICYERALLDIVLGKQDDEIAPGMRSALQDSLFEITEHGAALSRRFYAALENRAPEIDKLLPVQEAERHELFLGILNKSVSSLSGAKDALEPIKEYGRALRGIPLRAEYRKTIEIALLSTLKQAFGSKWDGDLEHAWTALYRRVSLIVLDARDEAEDQTKAGDAGETEAAASEETETTAA